MKKFFFSLVLFMWIYFGYARVLTVGIYDNKPLLFLDENQMPQGLFVDVLEDIASKENWILVYHFDEWNNLLQMLKNNEIDILADIAVTSSRQEIYDYNKQNIFVNWGELYAKQNSSVSSFLELENKRVLGVKGDVYFLNLQELLNSFSVAYEPVYVNDYVDVFEALENGLGDVGTVNRMYGVQFSKDYRIKDTGIIFRPTELRYASAKDKNSLVLSTIDFHVEEMKKRPDSAYYKSINHHIGGMVRVEKRRYNKYFIGFIVAGFFILLLILLKRKIFFKKDASLLSDSLEQVFKIEESLPLPIVHFDEKGKICFANSHLFDMVGECLGRNICDYFTQFDFEKQSKISMLKTHKSFTVFKTYYKKNFYYVAIHLENTELSQAREVLHRLLEFQELFMKDFPFAWIEVDLQGHLLSVNKKFIEVFEFTDNDYFMKRHHTLWDLLDPDTVDKILDKDKNEQIKGILYNHNSDEIKVTCTLCSGFQNDSKISVIITDTSAEEKIKEQLSLNSEIFREIFETSPLSICILNMKEEVADVNHEFEQSFGFLKQDIRGKNIIDFFISTEYHPQALKIYEDLMHKGFLVYQTQRLRSDGSLADVIIYASKIRINDEDLGILAIYKDITEDKARMKLLNSMREKYDNLISSSSDIICYVDSSGDVIDISDSATKLTGWSKSEMMQRNSYMELIHPDDRQMLEKNFNYILKSKSKNSSAQYRLKHKQGHYIWLDEIGSYVRNCNNDSDGILFIARDMTELKAIEKEIVQQKDFYYNLLNYTEDGVLILDSEGKAEFFNKRFLEWCESDLHERHYQELFSVLHQDFPNRIPLDRTKRRLSNVHLKFLNTNKMLTTNISIIPFTEDDKEKYAVIISDVTSIYKYNSEISKLKNIETLQNYTYHLANDFNNILTAIMGHISLLKISPDLPFQVLERIQKAEDASHKAMGITQRIFPLQKMKEVLKSKFNLRSLIDKNVFDKPEVRVKLIDRVQEVTTNPSMAKEVVRIVLENSFESISGKGEILIESNRLNIAQDKSLPLSTGFYTVLKITDSGKGFDIGSQEKLFEPYFSTKNKEGLGLTKALHIMRLLNGYITVSPAIDSGTSVCLYFPEIEPESELECEDKVNCKGIKVLFMDDESLVRDIALEFMTKLGFDIVLARNGEEVLALSDNSYDIYILDLIVDEGMGAKETAQAIFLRNPQAVVFLTTGMKTDKAFMEYKNFGFKEIIEKPIDFYQLKRKIIKYYEKIK